MDKDKKLEYEKWMKSKQIPSGVYHQHVINGKSKSNKNSEMSMDIDPNKSANSPFYLETEKAKNYRDFILDDIFNKKEVENRYIDSVIANVPRVNRQDKPKIDEIIRSHHHHPSTYEILKYIDMNDLKKANDMGNVLFSNMSDDMNVVINDHPKYYDLISILEQEISRETTLLSFLNRLKTELFLQVNYVYLDPNKRNVILVCNICKFDIFYVCILCCVNSSTYKTLASRKDFIDSKILLFYEHSSESVEDDNIANNDTNQSSDNNISNEENKKRKREDNVQIDQYAEKILTFEHVKIRVDNFCFTCCSCESNGTISAKTVRDCILNVDVNTW